MFQNRPPLQRSLRSHYLLIIVPLTATHIFISHPPIMHLRALLPDWSVVKFILEISDNGSCDYEHGQNAKWKELLRWSLWPELTLRQLGENMLLRVLQGCHGCVLINYFCSRNPSSGCWEREDGAMPAEENWGDASEFHQQSQTSEQQCSLKTPNKRDNLHKSIKVNPFRGRQNKYLLPTARVVYRSHMSLYSEMFASGYPQSIFMI